MPHFVYLMASRPGGALYVGSTSDLRRRVEQHRSGVLGGHTDRYNIRTLVWFEEHPGFAPAFARERQIKGWQRTWKVKLILEVNPEWRDITAEIPW